MSRRFQDLRRKKGLTSREVADAAGVSLADEYLFEIGGIVDKDVGPKVVAAYERLTGESNTVIEQPTVIMKKLGGSYELSRRGESSTDHTSDKDNRS